VKTYTDASVFRGYKDTEFMDNGDLIAEVIHAVEMGAVAEDLALTIHPHPTLSETVMEAAEAALGKSVHVHKRRR